MVGSEFWPWSGSSIAYSRPQVELVQASGMTVQGQKFCGPVTLNIVIAENRSIHSGFGRITAQLVLTIGHIDHDGDRLPKFFRSVGNLVEMNGRKASPFRHPNLAPLASKPSKVASALYFMTARLRVAACKMPSQVLYFLPQSQMQNASTPPTKTVSDFCRPTFEFANRFGLSTSRRGSVIFNEKNWRIIEAFLRENATSVSGTYFDGMIDGSSSADRTIEQSIACAGKIFSEKRYGYGFHFYTDDNTLSISDCCDSVKFVLADRAKPEGPFVPCLACQDVTCCRLHKAAPELLDMCRILLKKYEEKRASIPSEEISQASAQEACEVKHAARALIAKAATQ